uniref:Uncharacterized protein LOC114325929 n=1 Tax=Diabrotica virgifera virgifera TaxID=50390 RepID=A0A6P7F3D3_DIAVI
MGEDENEITTRESILKRIEEFYTELYRTHQQDDEMRPARKLINNVGLEIMPKVTISEVTTALGNMKRNKAAGEDIIMITTDMILEGNENIQLFQDITTETKNHQCDKISGASALPN